jgi:RimJ/RimL family protein N-acetyltransferase
MSAFPRIATARLVLREFAPADASAVQRLASAREVADQTLLPHPYGDGVAEAWIATCRAAHEGGTEIVFAVERALDGVLVGAIGLAVEPHRACAKLGYWIGMPYWGRGYATECAAAVVAFGFETLALERVWAPRFRGKRPGARPRKVGLAHEAAGVGSCRARARVRGATRCLRWGTSRASRSADTRVRIPGR